MNERSKLACVGLDCHRNFSLASARDESGRIAWRQRLNHTDRAALSKELAAWPAGVPVILEGTFGWGWMSDELREAKLDPHLSSGRKVAAWRTARNPAKSNKKDADLFGVAGRKWLTEVCADESSLMRPSGRKTLAGFVVMLAQLRRQIAAATRQYRASIRRSPDVKRLTTLPGVSTVLAFTIAAEIGKNLRIFLVLRSLMKHRE